MRIINIFTAIYIIYSISAFGAVVRERVWQSGETFLGYLSKYGVSKSQFKNLSPDDYKYVLDIQAGEKFYELVDIDKNILIQALIPLGEEMQIQIARQNGGDYSFDIIPIVYKVVNDDVRVNINSTCANDIYKLTNNPKLGYILEALYKGNIDFRRLRKGDAIAFIYSQKSRLGKPFGQATIKAAVVNTMGKNRYIFFDEDGNSFNDINKEVIITKKRYKSVIKTRVITVKRGSRYKFIMPLKHIRITSKFTYKRWHPILHRYRPHLGVDFGARRGTPIYAISSGRVIYAGWLGGYGKAVKIRHRGGYISLYAHMSRIKTRVGRYVKQGQVIGLIGSTGRSTGPHLHLSIYHHHKAINPLKVINKRSGSNSVKILTKYKSWEKYYVKEKKLIPIKGAKEYKERLLELMRFKEERAFKWDYIKSNFVKIKGDS